MTVSKIVKREELAQTLKDWLVANGVPPMTPLDLFFLPGEVIIRPHFSDQQELLEWLNSCYRRYDSFLRRLANG